MLTMMKFIVTTFVLLTLFISKNLALDAEKYIAYIEELSRDEKFLEEYTKWSSELISQPDYLYGPSHPQFPCSVNKSDDNNSISTSVHTLRPSDIKCIGAMGDSFTTGLGARAITPTDLLWENRGISWSVGGDYTYSKILTLPNILRQYNSKLKGSSTNGYVMSINKPHITYNRLNVAKSGDHSNNMPHQADVLIERLKKESLCDWNNDWKMITLFVGGNDLCSFCEDSNGTQYTPEQYLSYIRDTLDKLYNASIPRTFINLVLPPDVRGAKDLSNSNYICQTLVKSICPCAASPTAEQAKILDDYIPRYHQVLLNLIGSGRYGSRDDFTVVIQPFMAKTKLPFKDKQTIDFSYFAPDCFHFSDKGHSQAAFSLWNNMLEPVGSKQESWRMNESLKCPTKEYPYIFTSKNSAKPSDELNRTTIIQTTNRPSTISSNNISTFDVNTTNNYTSTVSSGNTINATFDIKTTNNRASTVSSSIFTSHGNITSQPHHKRHKDKKSKSGSSFNKMKFIVITGFLFIIAMILIAGIMRRRKLHVTISKDDQNRFNRLDNSQYIDDNDEEEVWSKSNKKTNFFDDNEIPKTIGTRVSLE